MKRDMTHDAQSLAFVGATGSRSSSPDRCPSVLPTDPSSRDVGKSEHSLDFPSLPKRAGREIERICPRLLSRGKLTLVNIPTIIRY
jgi:hypothetical protein